MEKRFIIDEIEALDFVKSNEYDYFYFDLLVNRNINFSVTMYPKLESISKKEFLNFIYVFMFNRENGYNDVVGNFLALFNVSIKVLKITGNENGEFTDDEIKNIFENNWMKQSQFLLFVCNLSILSILNNKSDKKLVLTNYKTKI